MSLHAASLVKAALACAVVAAVPMAVPAVAQDAGVEALADGDARIALAGFGRCVAAENPGESARVMALDFTSARYRTALRMLADDARQSCANDAVGRGNALRSANLLMAGAIAEGLLAGGAEPLNARLVRAAGVSAATFAPTDALAQCLARSLPDQTANLFAATPATAEETQAVAVLQAAVPACARAAGVNQRVEASVSALRAMIATATFRLLHSAEDDRG